MKKFLTCLMLFWATAAVAQDGQFPAYTFWGNPTGSRALPTTAKLTAIIDGALSCNAQGSILYRGALAWSCLAPGTSGNPLVTSGVAANPSWATLIVSGGGTNCSVASGTCLDNITGFSSTGYMSRAGAGTYTFSTTIPNSGLANAAAYTLKGNFTGSAAAPQDSTIGALTQKASPAGTDLILIQDQAAAGQLKYAQVSAVAVAGSVASINTQTGALTANSGLTNSSTQFKLDGNYTGFVSSNCTLTASVATNILTVALKDNVGNDPSSTSPCYINYPSPTTTTGATTLVPQTAALSINTNATGASLGTSPNTAFRFWVVSFNNSGTNVLALINCTDSSSNVFPLDESIAQGPTTPISGTATSAGVFYTPNGTTVTGATFRILGYIEYNSTGLATPGTYATAPTYVRNYSAGMKKPGDRVQIRATFSVAGGSTTSASLAVLTSSPSRTITPVSAANPIRVQISGTMNGSTAAGVYVLQLSRNTTAIGPQCNATVLSGAPNYPCTMVFYDKPDTTSSTTYQLQGSASAGTLSFPAVAGGGYQFEVEEIQG